MTMMPDAHPLVRRAIVALDAFRATTVHQACASKGTRRDDFTDIQVAEALGYYYDDDRDATGYGYRYESDEPAGAALLTGISGYSVDCRYLHCGGVR